MSFPPGTEMFQFPGFASRTYGFSAGYPEGWVSPFGHPRINDRSHLPAAYRSVPRPSSPLGAKASTERPCLARHHPPPPARRTKPRPAARDGAADIQANSHTLKLQPIPDSPVKEHPPGQHTQRGRQPERRLFGSPRAPGLTARRTPPPQDRRPRAGEWRRSGSNRRPPACKAGALPAELRPHTTNRQQRRRPGQRACRGSAAACRPSRQPASSASGGFLRSKTEPCSTKMGPGGLEPPTPRLSSVCSNQLSYWPAGPGFRPRPKTGQSASQGQTHIPTQPLREKDARTAPIPRRRPGAVPPRPSAGSQGSARRRVVFRKDGQTRTAPPPGQSQGLERLREQARCQDWSQPRDRRPSPHDTILERR
jgi:hypothetical protein